MENRSLDEFQRDEPHDTEATRNTTTPISTPPETTAVTAAQPTMDWTPDGAVCANCGETAQRRWGETDGETERLVCLACKSWE